MSEQDDLPWIFHEAGVCTECDAYTDIDEDELCRDCAKELRDEDEEYPDIGDKVSDFIDRPDPTRLSNPRDQER